MVCVQTWGNKCEMPSCVLEDKASDDHRMVDCAEVCVREGGRGGGREGQGESESAVTRRSACTSAWEHAGDTE